MHGACSLFCTQNQFRLHPKGIASHTKPRPAFLSLALTSIVSPEIASKYNFPGLDGNLETQQSNTHIHRCIHTHTHTHTYTHSCGGHTVRGLTQIDQDFSSTLASLCFCVQGAIASSLHHGGVPSLPGCIKPESCGF